MLGLMDYLILIVEMRTLMYKPNQIEQAGAEYDIPPPFSFDLHLVKHLRLLDIFSVPDIKHPQFTIYCLHHVNFILLQSKSIRH